MAWLIFCMAFGAGELIGFYGSRFAELGPLVGVMAILVALYGYGLKVRGWPWLFVFLLGVVLALSVSRLRREILLEACELNGVRPYTAVMTVEEPVTANAFASSIGPIKVRVMIAPERLVRQPAVGERWVCTGWLERTKRDDPGRRRSFWVKGRGTSARCVCPVDARWRVAFLRTVRRDLSRRMGLGIPERVANLNRAILLGERTRMAAADKEAFVAAGTIHIFAISGLHVMTVAGILALVFLLAGVPYRVTGLAVLPLLWFYVVLIGATPSAVRAAVMASFQLAAPFFWRRRNGIVAWAITFFIVYGSDPMKCYDVGCALSFAVMLGIVLWATFAGPLVGHGFGARVAQSAVAWLVSVPIAAHVFGRLTPGGIGANLLLVPAAGVSVTAALLGVMVSFLSEGLAAYVNNFAALVTEAMSGLSYIVAALPGAQLDIEPWPFGMCLAWYCAGALGLWLLSRILDRRRRLI